MLRRTALITALLGATFVLSIAVLSGRDSLSARPLRAAGSSESGAVTAAIVTGDVTPADREIRRLDGPAVRVGNGMARTYVLVAANNPGVPVEIGVALDEGAMDGLPGRDPHAAHKAAKSAHEHLDNHPYLLSLPPIDIAPYQFVELDWNPGGHEPPGIYDTPHFDFHFYSISPEERDAIVPSDPEFQKKADRLPPRAERPKDYIVAGQPDLPAPGVPKMGVHWVSVRSPELQKMLRYPAGWAPFTKTFIYGSWDGRFTFVEPMITRAYIMSKKAATDPALRNEVVPVSTAEEYRPAGWLPGAYRIMWDEVAKEYRIGLTQLQWRG